MERDRETRLQAFGLCARSGEHYVSVVNLTRLQQRDPFYVNSVGFSRRNTPFR